MVDGKITETGTYTELIENNGAFAEFLRNYSNVENEEEEEEDGECILHGLLEVENALLSISLHNIII